MSDESLGNGVAFASDKGPSVDGIAKALHEPFDPAIIKWKPQVVSGNRAMAIAYVDARVVQDRLDDVLGIDGWQDDYEALPDGSVTCRLKIRLNGEWLMRTDVGGQSEQPDGGDRMKSAFSDALKRTAVKFGIGRYLYRLPHQWVDYDVQRKRFAVEPKLPAWAIPSGSKPTPPAKAAPAKVASILPANGKELFTRILSYDEKLCKQGLIGAGDLVRHVTDAGIKAGHGGDMATWPVAGITLAVEQTKVFEEAKRKTSNVK